MRSTPENAELALLLEVAGTPKPGNVDRRREYPDLGFDHLLAGAVGAREGFDMAADGESIGTAFQRAIEGMAKQRGGNTQFGAILLLMPLVSAAGTGALSPERASRVVDATTVRDAVGFYRSFDHVNVAVGDPPPGVDPPDVRLGSDAVPQIRDRGLTLRDVMEAGTDTDGIAREWIDGFPRTFDAADRIRALEGPVSERGATVFLELLAAEVDPFVVTQHDRETAIEVRDRAVEALSGQQDVDELAAEFVERGINPGTTADLVAGALFLALEGGMAV